LKSTFRGTVHDSSIKNDGAMSYEFTGDFLGTQAGVKGLNFALKSTGNVKPSDKDVVLSMGIDFNNESTRFKTLFNVRNGDNESIFVHHFNKVWLFGGNVIFNMAKKRFTTYTAAALW